MTRGIALGWRTWIAATAAALTIACTVASCGPTNGAGGANGRRQVVVYSPHGVDVLGDYERRFEEAHPDIDVQWLDMGSQEILTRVTSERQRPQADVWWGAPSTMFAKAAKQGLLAAYRPTWGDTVAASERDPDDYWYGTFRSPLVIMYNTSGNDAQTAPRTWDELLDPKWRDKITIRKPLVSGTMRTFIGAMVLRAASEDAGIDWLRRLHEATEAYMENPQFLYDHMKRRADLVSVWLMPDVVLQRDRNGYPFGFVVPPQTPVLTEGIAVLAGAPHEEDARLFYEFVTTQEALAHQAEAYGKMPTRQDIAAASLPEWMRDIEIEAMDIDWAAFEEREEHWCTRWDEEVYRAQ